MSTRISQIIKEQGFLPDGDLYEIAEVIARECAELINAHAQNMEKYNFEEKARTARSCAGMILEHFNMKGK